jgi:hypothetical protein
VQSVSFGRLAHGLVVLRFRVLKGSNAPGVRAVVIQLPRAMGFRLGRRHGHALTTVHVTGGRLRYARIEKGLLVIVLRQAVSAFSVRVGGIAETRALETKAKRHHVHSLVAWFGVADASGKSSILRVVVHTLHL